MFKKPSLEQADVAWEVVLEMRQQVHNHSVIANSSLPKDKQKSTMAW